MGKLFVWNCIISCYCVFLVQCQFLINQDVENRIVGESLPLLLKFLNDDVGATINYNSGKIKHTQLKGDILEVDITTSVTCKSPSEQCNYESADCRGLLFVKPNEELQVLSVDCNPNSPIEEPIALPVKDEPCEGCLVDIDVNGKGVEQLAKNIVQHVESEKGKKYDLIKIMKVQTEVTNGVNFFLTVLIGRPAQLCEAQACNRDTKEDMYCLVKFFQEPGYYSPKNIISNNCTQTQTFIPVISKYESNDINLIDSGDKNGKHKEKDYYPRKSDENDILKELMSQIIPLDESESKSTQNMDMSEPNLIKSIELSSTKNFPDESIPSVIASSTSQEVFATEDEPISVGTDTADHSDIVEGNSSPSTDTIGKGSSTLDVVEQISPDQPKTKIEFTSEPIYLEGVKVDSTTDNVSEYNRRGKRSLVGGKQEIDVNDPKIEEYLGEAVDYLNANLTKGDSQLKLGKILSATSQIVSGVSFNIKAELLECSKDENSIEYCQNDPKLCDINVWYRPWLNSTIIKIICEEKTYSFDAFNGKNRSKRETLIGGHSPLSNDDPRISKHLEKLLPQLDSLSDKEHKLKIKKVISATSQVVAGTNWNIKAIVTLSDCEKSDEKSSADCGNNRESYETICKFKFWERLPDKDGKRSLEEVKIDCDDSKLNFRSKREVSRRKSRETLVGGHYSLSNDDPRISKHLEKLLPQLDSLTDKEHKLKIKKVLSATSQVVAGTNWNIKAIVTLSDCEKSDEKLSAVCGNNRDPYETICKFKFWERLPDKDGKRSLEEVKSDCDDSKLNFRSKREVPRRKSRQTLIGGHYPLSNDDPRISKHLEKLLPQLDSLTNKEHKLKIKKVLSATSQVVAGTNWKIKAIVTLSDCEKSDEKPSADCGNNKESYETICKFKFWERLPDKNGKRSLEEVKIDCDDSKLNFRSKREIPRRKTREILIGGHIPIPNDDPRISKHLEKLLPQFYSLSGKGHKLKLKKVLSATSQVVAGTNWNIKAIVTLSDCEKSDEKSSADCGNDNEAYETVCNFKFWERLPDENGERCIEKVKINCDDSKLNFRSKKTARSKRGSSILGGQENVDKNDSEINVFISESLRNMDLNSPYENKFKVREIISATKQVVAGYMWRIKVALVLSTCNKNSLIDWDQCDELEGAEPNYCMIKIWDRPWIKHGRETSITCDNQNNTHFFRSKRWVRSIREHSEPLPLTAFQEFEKTYNKKYHSPKERFQRLMIFQENLQWIEYFNWKEQGTAIYGPTKFADMTRSEYRKYLGYRSDLKTENEIDFLTAEIPDIDLPESFDWRDKNVVAEVKNQGSCGSCWAFSVTGNVEGQYAIKNGKLLEFSEQELVDCDTVDQGCDGGLMDNAYRQIEKLGGLEEEKDYPYDARDEKCHFNRTLARVQISGAVNISQNETEMAKWLVKNGPISIAINANAMQFYMGGVSHPWKMLCNPSNLDHGVLIVGYGVHTYPKFKKSLPYWIVKNSWGESWGEQGYYRVYRGDGTCGVNQTPSSAILK